MGGGGRGEGGGSREKGIQQRFERSLDLSCFKYPCCRRLFLSNWNEDIRRERRLSSPVRRPRFLLGFIHSKGGKVHPRSWDISNSPTSSTVFIYISNSGKLFPSEEEALFFLSEWNFPLLHISRKLPEIPILRAGKSTVSPKSPGQHRKYKKREIF